MSDGTSELYVFDTDIISECLRENAPALAFLASIPIEKRRTTVVNEGELLTGRFQQFQGADTIERLVSAQQRLDQTKEFVGRRASAATFPALLPMDAESAALFFDLSKQRGLRKIGRRDLMIAAIAIAHRTTLVTGNVQHFARVPRLTVRGWRVR